MVRTGGVQALLATLRPGSCESLLTNSAAALANFCWEGDSADGHINQAMARCVARRVIFASRQPSSPPANSPAANSTNLQLLMHLKPFRKQTPNNVPAHQPVITVSMCLAAAL